MMADIALFRSPALMLACCLTTVGSVAHGQTVYLGLQGGGNVATFAGRDVGLAASRTGFALGTFALVRANPVFAFRPGILYSQQGAQESASGYAVGVRLSYLEVPLLANVTLPAPSSGMLTSLYAGPVVDLQLGCNVSAASGSVSLSLPCNDPQVGLKTSNVVFGAALGVGLDVPAGSGLVTLDARYALGLNTIDAGDLNLDVRNRALTILAGYAFSLGPRVQTTSLLTPRGRDVVPAMAVGVSVFEFNEQASVGAMLRVSAWERPYVDLTTIGQRWPTLGGGSGWAGGLEAGYYPVGRGPVVPRVALGVGYLRALAPPGYIGDIAGVTTSLGLGVRAQIARVQLGAEALIRDDAGLHGDAELRFLGGYAPALRPDSVRGAAGVFLLGMVPLRGPWRFVEPGYEARLATRVTERYAGSLSLALLHWRIPDTTYPTGYAWDTRAVLVEPGWQWGHGSSVGKVQVTAGPAIAMMFEGPDDGMRGGAHAEVRGTLRAGAVPLTAGVGWFWFHRAGALVGEDASDQHGIMLSAGVGY